MMPSALPGELQKLAAALQEAGFPSGYFAPGDDNPFHLVRALLDGDRAEPELLLEITPVAGLDDLSILQFIVGLPVSLSSDHLGTLGRYLLDLNTECLLSGFGMRADARLLYYRTMVPGRPHVLDVEMLVEVVWTVAYLIERYVPLIRPVASGDLDLPTAVNVLQEHLHTPYTPSKR
jgi:hypothetical protein